ncbi:hypothetical protein [Sinorhizobium fredii]|uniref:hypothetical protein n=1 Tax=Rhizobium fredii TaxID=380 RepID=UPI003515F1BC
MPNVLWNIANIERVVDDVKQRLRARQAQSVVTVPKIKTQIEARRQQQKAVLTQITERMVVGKPALSTLDEWSTSSRSPGASSREKLTRR